MQSRDITAHLHLTHSLQESSPGTSSISMAQAPTIAMALASSTPSMAIPNARDKHAVRSCFSAHEKHAHALLTPPSSISPNMPAHGHGTRHYMASPPLINIDEEIDLDAQGGTPPQETAPGGMPLSRGALSGLDASAAITPAMLAKDYLPGIMLGNGPRPIRNVIGELTHCVPGFSRIPPAKARRLVVAALESRSGGGPDGNVAFCKTGWGRWDAHVKGSSRDSAIGSFTDARFSPPRSEHSGYAFSHNESSFGMSGPGPANIHRGHCEENWTSSGSLREEDEMDDVDMDMDALENEADKMSLDEDLPSSSVSDDFDSATDDDDWAAPGPAALRKASLPTPGMPQQDYQALSVPLSTRRPSYSFSRRPSGMSERSFHATSLPQQFGKQPIRKPSGSLQDLLLASKLAEGPGYGSHRIDYQTPEEKAAIEALMQLGSM